MKKSLVVLMAVAALTGLMAVPVFAADKLVVMDAGGTNTVFVVQDTGNTGVGTAAPQSQLYIVDQTGTNPSRGIVTAQHNNGFPAAVIMFKKSRGTEAAPATIQNGDNGGAFHTWLFDGSSYQMTSSIVTNVNGTVAVGSVPTDLVFYTGSNSTRPERMRITSAGYVGIGTTAPTHLIHLSGGAYSDGATWQDASSREYKENIQTLSANMAVDALKNLTPVLYNYKTDAEQKHVGFIAEDVPDLVATKDRKGLSAMDIVAVLTKVVQEQNKMIEALSAKIDMFEKASRGK